MPLGLTPSGEVDSSMLQAIIDEREWQVGLPGLDQFVDDLPFPPQPYGQIKLCPECVVKEEREENDD